MESERRNRERYLASTFSIVAYDPKVEEWGVAVQSKAFIVGGIVPWAKAVVGAIATQAWTNMSYGPRGLTLLRRGLSPQKVIEYLTSRDPQRERRQLGVVDAHGRTACYTGRQCLPWAGGIAGENYSVQGNILASRRVATNMVDAFRRTTGKLAERLLIALEAGQRAGGDRRGQQAAALLIVRARSDIDGLGDHYVDLRVDDNPKPIAELRRLYEIWERTLYPSLEIMLVKRLIRSGSLSKARMIQGSYMAKFKTLLRRNPKDADLRNTIAWELSQAGQSLDLALKCAKEAVRLAPTNPDILDTLAELYFRLGEAKRAVEIERAVVKQNPDRLDLRSRLKVFEKGL